MRPNSAVILGAVIAALAGGAAAYHAGALNAVIGRPAPPEAQPAPTAPVAPQVAGVVPLAGKVRSISIPYYVIKQTNTDPVLVEETTSLNAAGSVSVWRQAHVALTAMAGFPRGGALQNPLPDGTKVLGVHVDNSGIATVDLSPQFRDNFNGGAREEQVTLYAVVNTVGSVKGVQGVRFAIAGRTLDEFAGHIDLSSPLTPDPSLVEQAQ
ncbi:MAG TPA: GerMN domain-containing protein [Armatimonadota bacterium]|jgi:spore germination protein GerM